MGLNPHDELTGLTRVVPSLSNALKKGLQTYDEAIQTTADADRFAFGGRRKLLAQGRIFGNLNRHLEKAKPTLVVFPNILRQNGHRAYRSENRGGYKSTASRL